MRYRYKATSRKLKIALWGVAGFISAALSTTSAQESINTSGGNGSGSGGSVSYSVGQMVFTAKTGSNGTIVDGVQQPFEIVVVTTIDRAKDITLKAIAYPNPTTDYLLVSVADFDTSTLSYQLFDLKGKLLESGKLEGRQTRIDMRAYMSATYFIQLIVDNTVIKKFKVIKNN
jgi:hypothetical protein